MNKKTIYWTCGIAALIIILLIIWASLGGNAKTRNDTPSSEKAGSDNLRNYLKEQDALMGKMMEDMTNVESTGNAALDFLNGMIPHHQAAVEMCESYMKYGGRDEELRKLAETSSRCKSRKFNRCRHLPVKSKMEALRTLNRKRPILRGTIK